MVMMITYDIIHDVKIMGILGLGVESAPSKMDQMGPHLHMHSRNPLLCTDSTIYIGSTFRGLGRLALGITVWENYM
jgi:hypothetical protein